MIRGKQTASGGYSDTDNSNNDRADLKKLLENSLFESLKTYSNVHRGSGHKSIVTTSLYEHSRLLVLDYLGLSPVKYQVIFCTPYLADSIEKIVSPAKCRILSSRSFGLSIGVRAVVVKKGSLPNGAPPLSGGGTAKLISKEWVIWAKSPKKYEAGTPAIVNIITFTRALMLVKIYGKDIFTNTRGKNISARELLYTDQLDGLSGTELLNELRRTRIGMGLQVPVVNGKQDFINLDNSASTSTFVPVWDAFRHSLSINEFEGNEIVNEARNICSDFLGASLNDFEIIFTGNATESINLVARNLGKAEIGNFQPVVACTLMEHSSNDLPWRTIPDHTVIRIPVDKEGFINHKDLEDLLEAYNLKDKYGNQRVRLVAVSGASNVLGTCNDLKEISRIVHKFNATLLVDGAQLVAHRKVEMDLTGIDYFAFSAHKVYAPFGSGVLAVRKGLINFSPQERKIIIESGQENVAGIAALGKILHILKRIGMPLIEKEEKELTAQTLREMGKIPGMKLVGIKEYDEVNLERRVGVIPFNLKNKVSFQVGKELACYNGIGVRVGCHCAHILVKHVLGVSPGLERFQRIMQTLVPALSFPGLVRVSLGIENTGKDIKELLKGLEQIQLRSKNGKSKYPGNEIKKTLSNYTAECNKKVFG